MCSFRFKILICIKIILIFQLLWSQVSAKIVAANFENGRHSPQTRKLVDQILSENEEKEETAQKIFLASSINSWSNNNNFSKSCAIKIGHFLPKIHTSILGSLDFLVKNLPEIIVLDPSVGLRVLEAQLTLLLSNDDGVSSALPLDMRNLMSNLKSVSGNMANQFINKFREGSSGPQEYKAEQLSWVTNVSVWTMPPLKGWILTEPAWWDEFELRPSPLNLMRHSDPCIASIFSGCRVNEEAECVKFFMEKPAKKFSLTHQIFFFYFAQKLNCFDKADFVRHVKGGEPIKYLRELCANSMDQARLAEAQGFPKSSGDIFNEQIATCALAGYGDFLKLRWLRQILSWQTKTGCYPMPANFREKNHDYDSASDYSEQDENSMDQEVIIKKEEVKSHGRKRVKRYEQPVKVGEEDCSVHFTTTSLLVLSMYMRYFLENCFQI